MFTSRIFLLCCFSFFQAYASQDHQIIIVNPGAPLLPAQNQNHRYQIRLPGQDCEPLGALTLIAGTIGVGVCGTMCCTNPAIVFGLIASSGTCCYGALHIFSACCE